MANSFAVTITAKDSASGTIDAINKRMAAINKEVARARAPFEQLAGNITKFSKVTGLDRIAAGVGNVARSGFSAFQSVARIVEPLAAITGAASIAGMMRLATAWADFGSALGNTAARAGLTSEQLQVLQNAGQLAGVSADALAGGMTSLRDNMVNAVGGRAPQVIGMLQALGLSLSDAKRFSADTTKALPELADKIAALKDPTLQAEVATTLFGGAGEAMLPFLRKGSAGIAEYTERARKYGLINQDGVAAANQLREAQVSLTLAVQGLGNSIAQQLAPTIVPLLGQMADWIAANRDWIAQGIGEKVQQFATYMQGVDWAKVGSSVSEVVHEIKAVVDALGGIVPAAEIVVGFFAVAWLAKMTLPILAVSRMLLKLPGEAAVAAAKSEAEMARIGKGGLGGGLFKGLAGMAGLGLLEGVLSGQMGRDAASNMDKRDAAAANPPPAAPDTRHWWERFYKPGPGLFSGGGAPPNPNAPNGVPPTGPRFGPQQSPGQPQQAPGQSVATPSASHAAFYQKYDHAAQMAADSLGVDKRVILAHWAQETGFGRSAHDNNLGNIQAGPGYTGPTVVRGDTHADGTPYQTRFRSYQSPDEFAKDYSEMIRRRFPGAIGAGGDALKFGRGLKAGGYMEDPDGPAHIAERAATVRREMPANMQQSERSSGPVLALPTNAGTASNPGVAGAAVDVNGQIGVNVRVAAPVGTTTTATQTGSALAPLKVEQTGVGYDDRRVS